MKKPRLVLPESISKWLEIYQILEDDAVYPSDDTVNTPAPQAAE